MKMGGFIAGEKVDLILPDGYLKLAKTKSVSI